MVYDGILMETIGISVMLLLFFLAGRSPYDTQTHRKLSLSVSLFFPLCVLRFVCVFQMSSS